MIWGEKKKNTIFGKHPIFYQSQSVFKSEFPNVKIFKQLSSTSNQTVTISPIASAQARSTSVSLSAEEVAEERVFGKHGGSC